MLLVLYTYTIIYSAYYLTTASTALLQSPEAIFSDFLTCGFLLHFFGSSGKIFYSLGCTYWSDFRNSKWFGWDTKHTVYDNYKKRIKRCSPVTITHRIVAALSSWMTEVVLGLRLFLRTIRPRKVRSCSTSSRRTRCDFRQLNLRSMMRHARAITRYPPDVNVFSSSRTLSGTEKVTSNNWPRRAKRPLVSYSKFVPGLLPHHFIWIK